MRKAIGISNFKQISDSQQSAKEKFEIWRYFQKLNYCKKKKQKNNKYTAENRTIGSDHLLPIKKMHSFYFCTLSLYGECFRVNVCVCAHDVLIRIKHLLKTNKWKVKFAYGLKHKLHTHYNVHEAPPFSQICHTWWNVPLGTCIMERVTVMIKGFGLGKVPSGWCVH